MLDSAFNQLIYFVITTEADKNNEYRNNISSLYNSGFIFKRGETVWGHEFHHSTLTIRSSYPLFKLSSLYGQVSSYTEGWCNYNIHASYLHLHFGNSLKIPRRFLIHCANYSKFSTTHC